MKRSANIEDILQPLHKACNQAYLSNAVQVADILEWILGQVGKRYLCEKITATFTENGMSQLLKAVMYPILD